MPIADDTRREIEAVLGENFPLHPDYATFLVKWLAFNRAYNDLLPAGRDIDKVLDLGQQLQKHWAGVTGLAVELVSLECIGGERVEDSELLKPTRWVKSATLYLRERLNLQAPADPHAGQFVACRMEKRRLCNDVIPDPWDRQEMAALLRLVYQVRCILVHGDKQLLRQNMQTNRDHQLVQISADVLNHVLQFLLREE